MISRRTQELSSFIVMDVLERAREIERQGARIIHLEIGEPDFDTPDFPGPFKHIHNDKG